MPETNLETQPSNQLAVLLTLTYGDSGSPHVKRYTHWDEALSVLGNTFESVPSLSVDLGEQTSTLEDRNTTIDISKKFEPFATLASGAKHARVKVLVQQINPLDPTTLRDLFFGFIGKVTKNPGGRAGLVRATCTGVKSQLQQIRMGIPATTECQWQFAGHGCEVDRSAHTYVGTVSAIGDPSHNSVTLTLPGVTTPATELANAFFRRGQVVVDGLPIPIRASREDGRFDLFQIPPASWLGKACTLLPGCDKRLLTCRNVWLNEERFLGLGIAIPPKNPLFEE